MILQKLTRARRARQLRIALSKWKSNTTVSKVVETAFNKMLKLNYQHAASRFQAAGFLLKKSCIRRLKKVAFDNVICFAKMTQLSVGHHPQRTSMFLDSQGTGYLSSKQNQSNRNNNLILSCD